MRNRQRATFYAALWVMGGRRDVVPPGDDDDNDDDILFSLFYLSIALK